MPRADAPNDEAETVDFFLGPPTEHAHDGWLEDTIDADSPPPSDQSDGPQHPTDDEQLPSPSEWFSGVFKTFGSKTAAGLDKLYGAMDRPDEAPPADTTADQAAPGPEDRFRTLVGAMSRRPDDLSTVIGNLAVQPHAPPRPLTMSPV